MQNLTNHLHGLKLLEESIPQPASRKEFLQNNLDIFKLEMIPKGKALFHQGANKVYFYTNPYFITSKKSKKQKGNNEK